MTVDELRYKLKDLPDAMQVVFVYDAGQEVYDDDLIEIKTAFSKRHGTYVEIELIT